VIGVLELLQATILHMVRRNFNYIGNPVLGRLLVITVPELIFITLSREPRGPFGVDFCLTPLEAIPAS
jgi:hypothetical protein